ncbi:MAG: creatininase family protein [Ahrensia sp.]|nr:creatininase family protein [Ahrensia sp.]
MQRFWRDMPTTAFNGDTSQWIAVLPVAAIEQHGPHLPVGVDSIIAEGLVERSAEALPADSPAVFLPVQQICKSNEHITFPGTLTLDWETTIKSWLDIGDSIARAGLRKLLIITSHGGNIAPMEIVARELRAHHDMLVVTTSWEKLGPPRKEPEDGSAFVDIHGGDFETSIMLALRPDLVEMPKARDFASSQSKLKATHRHLGYHSSDANIAWLSQDLNAAGVVGDAASASAEQGEDIMSMMVANFSRLIEEIAQTAPTSR